MGALSRFEQFVESALEGSFARLMRSQLQPVEVAKRLTRAMENEKVISAGKIFVPNDYRVALNPEDFRLFESGLASWEQELVEYLSGVAREQNLSLFGRPSVTIEANVNVALRQVQVATQLVERAPETPERSQFGDTQRLDSAAVREALEAIPAGASLVMAGELGGGFPIDKQLVLIGRAMDNDVVLDQPGVSRYHAQIFVRRGLFVLRDLKSTNGTRLNGEVVAEKMIADGDRLSFAGVDLLFRVGR